MEDAVVGIESVTNTVVATGGEDRETELDYNYRFNLHIEGLGRSNKAGLEAGALTVVGVTDALSVDLNPPVGNVNNNLYVDNNTTAGISDERVTEVTRVIDGDGSVSFLGYRSAGVNVVVLKPTIVTQNLEITMTIARAFNVTSMEMLVQNRIAQFINRLRIGIGLKIAELLAIVILVPGVVNAAIVTPSADVDVVVSQVVRAGTFTFTTTRAP